MPISCNMYTALACMQCVRIRTCMCMLTPSATPTRNTWQYSSSSSVMDMASHKRTARSASTLSGALSSSKKTKRQVTVAIFNKWKTQFERDHQAISWLHCDADSTMDNILRVTWIGNASRKRKIDSTVIVVACNGNVYGFP